MKGKNLKRKAPSKDNQSSRAEKRNPRWATTRPTIGKKINTREVKKTLGSEELWGNKKGRGRAKALLDHKKYKITPTAPEPRWSKTAGGKGYPGGW